MSSLYQSPVVLFVSENSVADMRKKMYHWREYKSKRQEVPDNNVILSNMKQVVKYCQPYGLRLDRGVCVCACVCVCVRLNITVSKN